MRTRGPFGCRSATTLLGLLSLVSAKAAAANYYTAGVVEFRPSVAGASSAELLAEHLSAYLDIIRAPEANETDIIVFPEATLNSVLQLTEVPEALPAGSACLCQEQAEGNEVANFLQQLACAAQTTRKYLVFNVKERAACAQQSCPASGHLVYNTNVVLDRNGCVVSRYRKWNLYLEPLTNRTAEPEFAVFETDFGVTFGHFICFDMLFYTPAQELVQRLGVRNLIVTKMFNSELPFLTASQFQQGWAWGNNVNLLAAGASLPQSGLSGSGIYAGQQGALKRLMVSVNGTRELLVARVPHSPQTAAIEVDAPRTQPAPSGLFLMQQTLDDFVTQPLLAGTSSQQLCQLDLCCNFEWSAAPQQDGSSYQYRLGVFVGQRTYEEHQYSRVRLCGVFACRNESLNSCGQVDESSSCWQFSRLKVSGTFKASERRQLMPTTLSSALYALQPIEMDWQLEEQDNRAFVQLQLSRAHDQLLTFGIYGNYFNESGSAASIKLHQLAMPLLSLLLRFC